MPLDVGTYCVPVIVVAVGVTGLMELGSAYHVSNLATAAFNGNIVLVLRVVEPLVVLMPLGVGSVAVVRVGLVDVSLVIYTGPHPEILQLVAAHHVVVHGEVGKGGNTPLAADSNGSRLVVSTALGGNIDNAVSGTGTVDGCCGGILQDGYREDVVRVHGHDGTAG